MRIARIVLAAVGALAWMCPQLSSQDKPKPDNNAPLTTLKLQVTFAEHEGEKTTLHFLHPGKRRPRFALDQGSHRKPHPRLCREGRRHAVH